jgi:hypothetical protein
MARLTNNKRCANISFIFSRFQIDTSEGITRVLLVLLIEVCVHVCVGVSVCVCVHDTHSCMYREQEVCSRLPLLTPAVIFLEKRPNMPITPSSDSI